MWMLGACVDPAEQVPAAVSEQAARQPAAPSTSPGGAAREVLVIGPDNSRIEWVGSKVTRAHEGRFTQFSGQVHLDPTAIERSRVAVTIDVTSLQVQPERLARHLRDPDFLDVARFPQARFESHTLTPRADEPHGYRVEGELQLHGVTRRIAFPARIELGRRLRADAEFSIDRMDFDIATRRGDDLVRRGVVICLHLDLPRRGHPTPRGG
jgi:polyisoprenoid-binding protein YceI